MTEQELRKKYIDCAKSYYGAMKGGKQHFEIVDTYNSYTPHPRNYVLTVNDAWCAAFVSTVSILCKMTDIIPVECSCSEQIKAWKNMGRWQEADDYRPSVGDILYYDWQDGNDYATKDNKNSPDHVGIVVWVNGADILVIEGNKGNSSVVGYREMNINGKYIRGYGLPDYASKLTVDERENSASVCTIQVPILRYGSKNKAVCSLQAMLNVRGAKLVVDGSFGPATKAAVYAFQMDRQIEVDGIVGPKTWSELVNGKSN